MTAPSRSQAEQALAAFLHCLRPDWSTPGILKFIRDQPIRPLDQIAAAALYATSRRDQHSPHLIGVDEGEAWGRLIDTDLRTPTHSPTRGCPYHAGQPKGCPVCARERATIADPERTARHLAAIRAALIKHDRQEQQ